MKDGNNETTIKVLNSDFLDKNIQIGSIDRILTSPPYLNRLDYVVSHKPEIAILTGFIPLSIEGLREKMMGTTKMIERVEPKEEWGEECLLLIDKIRNHPSKASSTYYYKFFLQYFDCCMKMFSRFRDVCNDDALGALVVQDSFYKDVRVPLTAILSDMARNYGITTHKWRSEEVKGHIGSMNPAQKSYVPTKVLEETVLFLEF